MRRARSGLSRRAQPSTRRGAVQAAVARRWPSRAEGRRPDLLDRGGSGRRGVHLRRAGVPGGGRSRRPASFSPRPSGLEGDGHRPPPRAPQGEHLLRDCRSRGLSPGSGRTPTPPSRTREAVLPVAGGEGRAHDRPNVCCHRDIGPLLTRPEKARAAVVPLLARAARTSQSPSSEIGTCHVVAQPGRRKAGLFTPVCLPPFFLEASRRPFGLPQLGCRGAGLLRLTQGEDRADAEGQAPVSTASRRPAARPDCGGTT